MSDKPATLVVTAVPNPDALQDMQSYLGAVIPILAAHGGHIVYRGKTTKAIKGDINFGMLLVMNFDTPDQIEKVFSSAEYEAIIPYRDKGFKKIDMVISEGL